MKKRFIEESIIDKIMQRRKVSKSMATKLYKNSLLYNTVVNEILDQIDYLVSNNIELV